MANWCCQTGLDWEFEKCEANVQERPYQSMKKHDYPRAHLQGLPGVYSFLLSGFVGLAGLASAALLAALRGCFALAAGLGTLIVRAATRLRENAILLNFAIKAFEGLLKRIAWIHSHFTHRHYQRDLRSLLRSDLWG